MKLKVLMLLVLVALVTSPNSVAHAESCQQAMQVLSLLSLVDAGAHMSTESFLRVQYHIGSELTPADAAEVIRRKLVSFGVADGDMRSLVVNREFDQLEFYILLKNPDAMTAVKRTTFVPGVRSVSFKIFTPGQPEPFIN